ncbi:MAG: SGNH/GDSL hydrolase family protein [Terriglobales bacterium]
MSTRKGGFWRGLAWFVGICLVLELVLRLFGYGNFVEYKPDARLLWVPEAGRDKRTPINGEHITINDESYRYPTDIGPKQPNQFRIFTFGDSVTMGWGVNDRSTYSAVLEQQLNTSGCGRQFQVIDAGVNAYPNSLVRERLKTVLESSYQPDLVVLAYSFNTGMENMVHLQGAAKAKILRGVKMKSMLRHSALYDFLIEGVLRDLAYYRFRELMTHGTWDTQKDKPDDPVEQFTAGLQETYEDAVAHQVPVVLLDLGSDDQSSELHPYQQAMIDFARKNNVPIVNMIDAWKSVDRKPLFMDHVHPTANGHARIGTALTQVVRMTSAYQSACAPATAVAETSGPAK